MTTVREEILHPDLVFLPTGLLYRRSDIAEFDILLGQGC